MTPASELEVMPALARAEPVTVDVEVATVGANDMIASITTIATITNTRIPTPFSIALPWLTILFTQPLGLSLETSA